MDACDIIVSILVLMDVGLRYYIVCDTIIYCHISFNPCFNGCRSAMLLIDLCLLYLRVSILVLMDVGLR